jgi:hypothetical protein
MKTLVGAMIVTALALSVGCSDDDNPSIIDQVTDPHCSEICDRFDECIRDIDVGRCVDQCDDATDNEAVDQVADRCANCLEDRSCAESGGCWNDCIAVPEMRLGTSY